MAPTAPSKRKSLRLKAADRLANPLAPRKVHRPDSAANNTTTTTSTRGASSSDTPFAPSKADKRLIKRSAFVGRIAKPPATADRRRRRKTTTTTSSSSSSSLAALADALPALSADEVARGAAERDGRVRHKSLRSKPGALRRKERVVRGDMARFGLSLAQLATVRETPQLPSPAAPADAEMQGCVQEQQQEEPRSTAANRFAALRGFISATLEQNPAFARNPVGGKGS